MSSPGPLTPVERTQIAQSLGLAQVEDANPQRVLELCALFAEIVTNLDQLAWGTWKAVSPQSSIKRQQNLRQLVAKFAANDPGVSRQQVKQELDRLRSLSAALLASLNQAGRQYAQKHAAALSPQQIEASVRQSGKSVMTGLEVQCWRKYVELAGGPTGTDADAIERDLLGAMAGHAEALLKGAGVVSGAGTGDASPS